MNPAGDAEATRIIQSGYEAFARQDVAAVLALFDPAIRWHAPDTVPRGGTYTGRDGVATFFSHLPELYRELHVQPDEFIEQGGRVVALGMLTGISAAGTAFALPFAHVWKVVDGLATDFLEFFDTVQMNAALGVPAAIDMTDAAKQAAR